MYIGKGILLSIFQDFIYNELIILFQLKVVQKELEETRTSLNDLTSRNTYLENQLNGMKKLAKQQNRNIKSIKRKRWVSSKVHPIIIGKLLTMLLIK